jgi:hypothetical protein
MVKNLMSMASSSAMRGLSSGFTSPKIFIGANVLPEAPLDNMAEAAQAMTAFDPDLIVAVGGGSVIDGAKGAWILYERPDIQDLGMVTPFLPLGLRKKAIFAAIPTTSGTGSECTSALVAHDTKTHRKIPVQARN